ncbi:MAG: hydantoinase/oxoprolinase family protein, partial [Gammaproteobacteria bacterium]|nr:hydantoinase/oxoprolinase family protein [Gammaproteobacteria bacterium]
TNALLERKGVKTAYVTNRGLSDVLSIGRQARKELYNLQPQAVETPVASELCFETGGRLGADGEIVEILTEEDLDNLYQQVEQAAPEAIAINLLFSFLDDTCENRIAEKLSPLAFTCRSSEILPEYKEYERGIATWLNAYVGPLMQGYLQRLQQGVKPARLSIMQSSGGTINAEHAARHSVHLLLSGPAGGLRAAQFIGEQCHRPSMLTFDMGGTSTDVALIDGQIKLTSEGEINGLPVAVPMVDMHTIGAGGGSIAWLDEGGMLQVGPQSAGAMPGPACYGNGGSKPTVTDANLILGRLQVDAFLGGGMRLDIEAARAALRPLAAKMACSIEKLAEGIIRVANEHMAQALRVISVQRGVDPRGYVLTSFGGAGGLHVCELAQILGLRQALVPVHGGVLSALGMVVSPQSREFSRTVANSLQKEGGESGDEDYEHIFKALELQGQQALLAENIPLVAISLERLADLRYRGQSYTITIPWHDMSSCIDEFHATHQQRFGHNFDEGVELVNLRVKVSGPRPEISLPVIACTTPASSDGISHMYGPGMDAQVYSRESLCATQEIAGPALITEKVSTTYISQDWRCRVDEYGNLHLENQRIWPKT